MMKIPTAKQLNPYGDLDGNRAEKNFLGKSIEDVEKMLNERFEIYQEDLMFMGPEAFCYYWEAIENYVTDVKSFRDWNVINYLAGVIHGQIENGIEKVVPKARILTDYVINNFEKFYDIDENDLDEEYLELQNDIYSDWLQLKEKLNKL